MTEQTGIEAAIRRLSQALDALDAAVERRLEADRAGAQLAEQLHALGADRSRLASELDAQAARSRRLETAGREASRRLDVAMDGIRAVLDAKS